MTGFSVARQLTPYLMVRDGSLGIPRDLRPLPAVLTPYGVEPDRRDDLESLLR